MSKVKAVVLLGAVFFCTLFIQGCSGKSAPSITLTPSGTVTINQGATQAITAAVAHDVNNAGVTWTLGSSDGTLTNPTKTSVTYVAPSVVSTTTTATVTATSVANSAVTQTLTITVDAVLGIATTSLPVGTQNVPYFGVISATGASGTFAWSITSGALPPGLTLASSTTTSATISGTPTTVGTSKFTIQVTVGGSTVSQALSITINPPPPLSVATRVLPNGTVNTPYNATLQAANGTPPYTWALTSGAVPAGLTVNTDGTITGTPGSTTTNPPPTFTVQVTDSSNPQQTASATLAILVNPSQSFNVQLSGTYAFLVRGFASGTPYAVAGSLVFDGTGKISTGVVDDPVNNIFGQSVAAGGSYLIDSDGFGTVTFTVQGITRTFEVVLPPNATTVSTNATLLECEGATCSTVGSGVLIQQTTSGFGGALSGAYAFGFVGTDASQNRYALAGEFTIGSGGVLDSDDAGTLVSNAAITISSGSIDSTTGRGTLAIIRNGIGTTNYAVYALKSTELFAVETDAVASNPLVAGIILQKSTSPSLNAVGVFETTANSSGAPFSQVGLLTPSSGSMTTSFDQSSTIGTIQSSSGTYSIDANQRVTFTGSGLGLSDPVMYLVSPNEGFLVGTDVNVTFGFMEPQTGTGTFSTSSLTGTYLGGSLAPITTTDSSEIDIGVGDGMSNLSLTSDIATSSAGLIQGQPSTPTVTSLDTTGRGLLNSGQVFYMVSGTEFWLLNSSGLIERFNSTLPPIPAIF